MVYPTVSIIQSLSLKKKEKKSVKESFSLFIETHSFR